MVNLDITENDGNQRLDRFLRKYLKRAPLAMIYRLIRRDVKVNGRRAGEDTVLRPGDRLTIYLPEDRLAELTRPRSKPGHGGGLAVVWEDENLLVVNKPAGLLTHGDAREKKRTLVNQVCGYLQERGEYDPARERTFTPAAAGRLDRNTSGLVLFGKNAQTLRELTRMIRERDAVDKFYHAVVCGRLPEELRLDGRLEKDEVKNRVRVVGGAGSEAGREALTFVRPLAAGARFSLAEIRLVTGRTHQIRVHLAAAGHPVAGDTKYGDRRVNRHLADAYGVRAQLLHACRLRMGQTEGPLKYLGGMVFEAPDPAIFGRIVDQEV